MESATFFFSGVKGNGGEERRGDERCKEIEVGEKKLLSFVTYRD
jgi:hypothetical protein